MGNGEREMGNGEWRTGNGEWEMDKGEGICLGIRCILSVHLLR